jgi:DNA-binding FadR family transcriptional regulator
MSTRVWVGRRAALTAEQAAELREVAQARSRLPTDRELAARFGCSPDCVRAYMKGYRPKRYALAREPD